MISDSMVKNRAHYWAQAVGGRDKEAGLPDPGPARVRGGYCAGSGV
jgi:hypothetical protein